MNDIKSPLLTVSETAAYVRLSRHTIYTMVSQRRIPFVKVGRLTMFRQTDLDRWIDTNTSKPKRRSHATVDAV